MQMLSKLGTLWVTATPLGNLGDISDRAKQALASAPLILAEDTRVTQKLLKLLGITYQNIQSYHEHNEIEKLPKVIDVLSSGKDVVIVSDAGTPLLSDPGYRLVLECREKGIKVSPIPGASAPVAALSASGFPPVPFIFLGFAPRKKGEQLNLFNPYKHIAATLIFFDRKDRLSFTLKNIYSALGERRICVAREISKTYEEFLYIDLKENAQYPDDLLGELTVLVAPPVSVTKTPESEVILGIKEQLKLNKKPKEAVREVQKNVYGWTSKEIYSLLQSKI